MRRCSKCGAKFEYNGTLFNSQCTACIQAEKLQESMEKAHSEQLRQAKRAAEAQEQLLEEARKARWNQDIERMIQQGKVENSRKLEAYSRRDCPVCGEKIKKVAKLCIHCKTRFPDAEELAKQYQIEMELAEKFNCKPWELESHSFRDCPSCGEKIKKLTKQCSSCKVQLSDAEKVTEQYWKEIDLAEKLACKPWKLDLVLAEIEIEKKRQEEEEPIFKDFIDNFDRVWSKSGLSRIRIDWSTSDAQVNIGSRTLMKPKTFTSTLYDICKRGHAQRKKKNLPFLLTEITNIKGTIKKARSFKPTDNIEKLRTDYLRRKRTSHDKSRDIFIPPGYYNITIDRDKAGPIRNPIRLKIKMPEYGYIRIDLTFLNNITYAKYDYEHILDGEVNGQIMPAVFCFESSTKIKTPNGSKPINKISLGESVYNSKNNIAKVIGIQMHPKGNFRKIYLAKNIILLTDNHKVETDKGALLAGQLKVGDYLKKDDNTYERIVKISNKREHSAAYNLIVYPGFSYIAEGIIAHSFSKFSFLRSCLWSIVPQNAGRIEHTVLRLYENKSNSKELESKIIAPKKA
jgi:hypothetical protein